MFYCALIATTSMIFSGDRDLRVCQILRDMDAVVVFPLQNNQINLFRQ